MTQQTWKLNSVKEWFDTIEQGTKTMEGRLMMHGMQVGDQIDFVCGEQHVFKQVVSITDYSCFAEMLDVEGIAKILPGITDMLEAVNIFKAWYPTSLQKKTKVIAIGLGSEKKK